MKPGEANKLQIHTTLSQIFGHERVVTEHKFHPIRRWRFDYAIPEIKLAVEYQGHAGFIPQRKDKDGNLIPVASGHSTIKGLTNDCEKMNSAIGHGWRVLTFTALHFSHKERERHKLTSLRDSIMNALGAMQNEKDL